MDEILKIAIIHGNKLVDGENQNGKIDYLTCTLEDDYFHIVMMINYLKDHFKDDEILQSYDNHTSVNTIALNLVKNGDIVYFNTTSYKKDLLTKHGLMGIVMMPDEATEEQKQSLSELKEKLDNYNVQVWYDITDSNEAKMKMGLSDVLDEFINVKTR